MALLVLLVSIIFFHSNDPSLKPAEASKPIIRFILLQNNDNKL